MSKLSKGCAIALSLSAMSFGNPTMAGDTCSPGRNWVDKCQEGFDKASSKATVEMRLEDGTEFKVELYDPETLIFRGNPKDGTIQTEMVSLNLTGQSPLGEMTIRAGDGKANLVCDDKSLCSLGAITTRPEDTTTADIFFDIGFEIEIMPAKAGSEKLISRACKGKKHRMVAGKIIAAPPTGKKHVPPSSEPLPICDKDGNQIGWLTDSIHVLLPPKPSSCVLAFDGDPKLSCYQWRYDNQAACRGAVGSQLPPGKVISARWYRGLTCAALRKMGIIPPWVKLSVTLDSFLATAGNGAVALEWATGTEKDNAGFVVWRAQPLDGTCSTDPNNYMGVQAITPLVASQGTEVSGATYTMTDSGVVSGNTYCYALEDIDYNGKSTFHMNDIVSATP